MDEPNVAPSPRRSLTIVLTGTVEISVSASVGVSMPENGDSELEELLELDSQQARQGFD